MNSIDVPRLFIDLDITEADLRRIADLDIPVDQRVPSQSVIKTSTVEDTLHIVRPGEAFDVLGVKSPSGVAEQPVGQVTIDGALNRLNNGIEIRSQLAPGEETRAGWISIENGIFRVSPDGGLFTPRDLADQDIRQFTEGADLTTDFDPEAEYEDRAVVALRIPGYPTIVQLSPVSEVAPVPKAAVHAAYNADGGFDQYTAGSQLAVLGLVQDKQNPHVELTQDRAGGPLPRQDQMARVMIRALLRLT